MAGCGRGRGGATYSARGWRQCGYGRPLSHTPSGTNLARACRVVTWWGRGAEDEQGSGWHERGRAAEGGAPAVVTRGRVSSGTVLGVASFGAFLAFLDATIVNVAFPSIRESFPDSTISNLSWVLNAYNIVFAAFLVPFGRLTDLIGRRRAFVWGVLVFTVASVICALSPSVAFLIGARVVQALGAAMLVPASLALVVAAFPARAPDPRRRPVGGLGRAGLRARPADRRPARAGR